MTTDIWQWWRDALAGKAPAIDANTPQCGFYKTKRGDKWLPVMIRYDAEGAMRCRIGNDSSADAQTVWTWCAGNPISKEAAKEAFDTGSFPGDVPSIGDNSADLSLADQIKEYAAQALAWLRKSGIKDTKSKDTAANYRTELLRLRKEADAQRAAEKRPHDDAAKAVQAKWMPLVDAADEAAETLRGELTKFMRAEEEKARAEQQAKYEAERKAAEAARAEIEAQRAKLMRDDPIAALTSPEPELPMAPQMTEAVKIQAGGQRGRKTGLREITRYVVTDHTAALAFFATNDDVRDLVAKLAERACKAGVAVPGVVKHIDKVAA